MFYQVGVALSAIGCAGAGMAASPTWTEMPALSRPTPSQRAVTGAASEPLPTIVWRADPQLAQQEAERLGCPLVIYAHADWSTESRRVEREVWADPAVVRAMQGYVSLQLNLSQGGDAAGFTLDALGIEDLPAVVVRSSGGVELGRTSRFSGPEELVAFLRTMGAH